MRLVKFQGAMGWRIGVGVLVLGSFPMLAQFLAAAEADAKPVTFAKDV